MNLIDAVMTANCASRAEAIEIVNDMAVEVEYGEDPEQVLYNYGLEPDYVLDLMNYVRYVVV